jgi:hypothetical protein
MIGFCPVYQQPFRICHLEIDTASMEVDDQLEAQQAQLESPAYCSNSQFDRGGEHAHVLAKRGQREVSEPPGSVSFIRGPKAI